jgi:TonB family protein
MPFRIVAFSVIVLLPHLASASCPDVVSAALSSGLSNRERALWASTKREAEFAAVPQNNSRPHCTDTQQPEALATPTPLLDSASSGSTIRVSFIIGTDGRVHSPLMLESGGSLEDRIVLDAVRSWRFRPATCNGVPTETEARIGFSSR